MASRHPLHISLIPHSWVVAILILSHLLKSPRKAMVYNARHAFSGLLALSSVLLARVLISLLLTHCSESPPAERGLV